MLRHGLPIRSGFESCFQVLYILLLLQEAHLSQSILPMLYLFIACYYALRHCTLYFSLKKTPTVLMRKIQCLNKNKHFAIHNKRSFNHF